MQLAFEIPVKTGIELVRKEPTSDIIFVLDMSIERHKYVFNQFDSDKNRILRSKIIFPTFDFLFACPCKALPVGKYKH